MAAQKKRLRIFEIDPNLNAFEGDLKGVMRLTLGGSRERSVIRTRAALYALDLLRRMALGLPVPDATPFTPETDADTLDI